MGDSGMLRLGRMLRAGALTDLVLLAVFVTLAFVFVQRRGYVNSVTTRDLMKHPQDGYKVSEHARENTAQEEPQGTITDITALIDDRIRQIADVRTKKCRTMSYDIGDLKVALIVHFFDYEFFDLKTTMSSIVHHTSMELIREIIIVDDGSTLEYIKEDAKVFVDKFPMARMLRLDDRQGASNARSHALEEVKAPITIFLDTNVIVSEGWLEPLISLLRHEPNTVAIPHYDNINDPVSYEYVTTDMKLATIFSWSFTVRMFLHPEVKKDAVTMETPVMRGNALAARTRFIKNLGAFDRSINDPAGESLEFSFRIWLCGGVLKIASCSRVGILTLNEPLAITKKKKVPTATLR